MGDGGGLGRCMGMTRKGKPCRARAERASRFCAKHQGQIVVGEQAATPPAQVIYRRPTPGLETIEDVIRDMLEWQSQFTALIEERVLSEGIAVSELAKLLAVHGQNASRIGQLLRDQRALSGEAMDGLLAALATALDELGTELGTKL